MSHVTENFVLHYAAVTKILPVSFYDIFRESPRLQIQPVVMSKVSYRSL